MTTHTIVRRRPQSGDPVAGIAVPGFINNDSYFFTELDVFADGVVACWGAVDLDLLAKKFSEGWISPGVPDGAQVSVHDVIRGVATEGQWSHNVSSFHERLLACVREMNPSMSGLVDFEGSDVEVRDGIRYAKIGSTEASPCRHSDGKASAAGTSRYALVNESGQVYLTTIRIYADGTIDVHPHYGKERLVDFDEFKRLVKKNLVGVTVPNGSRIEIDSVGRFEVNEVWSYIRRKADFVYEVGETIDELNGQQSAVEKCREAFRSYLDKPTIHTKELLKQAYEAVPEHHRMYVGDMDTKDIPVRMVIYGDQEIESWSHRLVARSKGDKKLPSIEVPKPMNERE